jgi:hypothetical protein
MWHRPERKRADGDWSIENIELIEAELTATAASTRRLKRFDRSAKEQFEQHRLWLEHYLAAEAQNRKEHERRLRQTRQRRKRRAKREAVRRRLEQGALAILLFLRSCGLSLFHRIGRVLIYCLASVFSSTAWLAAQIHSLAGLVIKNAYALARWLARLIWIGFFWSRLRARAFAISLANVVSICFSAIRREGYALTRSAAELFSVGLSGGHVKAHATAVALLDLASLSYSWMVTNIRHRAPLLSELAKRYRSRGFVFAGRPPQTWVSLKHRQHPQERTGLKLIRLLLRPSISHLGASTEHEQVAGLISKPAPILYLGEFPTSISRLAPRMMAAPVVGRTLKGAWWGYLALWMFLAGYFSYYFFFTRSTNPVALEKQSFSPRVADIQIASRLTTGHAAGPMKSSKLRNQELSEIQAGLRELSQQIARLDTRLEPIEESVAVAKSGRSRDQKVHSQAAQSKSNRAANDSGWDRPAAPLTRLEPIEESVAVAKSGPRDQKVSDSQAAQSKSNKAANESGWDRPAAPLSGPLLAEEPLPETVAEEAAEKVGTSEDFTFCRKWLGLGTIVCRKKDGTALVFGPADRTTLTDGSASPEAPSGPVAIGDAKSAAPLSRTGTPEESAGEIASDKIRYGIELGRAHQPGELMQLWRHFLTSHVALAKLEPRQVLTPAQDWRLIAGPFNTIMEARAACALLNRASKPCRVSLYAGDPLGLKGPFAGGRITR